jgi:NhaP-type Na+/H+ or K+/H+ antiporter
VTDARWFVVAGVVLIAMALSSSRLGRLPLSASMIYLTIGAVIGPLGLSLLIMDPIANAEVLELITELAVVASLFTAGLKLRLPLTDRGWLLPVRLATVSMIITVALLTAVGTLLLGLPLGAAILLGAILAPTDPVLASDVQVSHAHDRDRLASR